MFNNNVQGGGARAPQPGGRSSAGVATQLFDGLDGHGNGANGAHPNRGASYTARPGGAGAGVDLNASIDELSFAAMRDAPGTAATKMSSGYGLGGASRTGGIGAALSAEYADYVTPSTAYLDRAKRFAERVQASLGRAVASDPLYSTLAATPATAHHARTRVQEIMVGRCKLLVQAVGWLKAPRFNA